VAKPPLPNLPLAPLWLVEFHRQWVAARGRRIAEAVLAFSRDWETLLDAAGLRAAADRKRRSSTTIAVEGGGFRFYTAPSLGAVNHLFNN